MLDLADARLKADTHKVSPSAACDDASCKEHKFMTGSVQPLRQAACPPTAAQLVREFTSGKGHPPSISRKRLDDGAMDIESPRVGLKIYKERYLLELK